MGGIQMSEDILTEEQKQETLEHIENQFGTEAKEEVEEKYTNPRNLDIEIEETDIEIGSTKAELNFDIFTKNIEDTEHLPGYKLFDSDLGLEGDSYKAFKKAFHYWINSVKQPTLHYRINNKTHIDNRKHLLCIAPASAGKSTAKNMGKRCIEDEEFIEASGISHPEQLIGKMKYKGKGDNKTPVPAPGILSYKAVFYDEAQELINEKNDICAKSMRIKRIAMDTYTENAISKKLVDDTKAEILQYDPECRIFDFAHPKKLEAPFFDNGSFRRYDIFNLSYDSEIILNDVVEFTLNSSNENKRNFEEFLTNQYSKQMNEVNFTQENLDIISHFHKCLLYYLLNHKNQNAFRYGLLTRYSLRSMFCKNVLILAIEKGEHIPSRDTTINACKDSLLFILKSIESINSLGDMGISSDVWGGVCENDAQALEYLYKKGSTNYDNSSVSIRKFWTILGHLYGCKVTQARSHFYRLKRDGFIDSRKGQYDSKVWLKYIPKIIKLNSKDYEPTKFWDNMFQSVGTKNTLLTLLKSLITDDKRFEIMQSDGSVGVMGCILCMRKPQNNKNKNNNIYTGYPPYTDTSDTLVKIDNLQRENGFESVKTPKTKPTLCPKKEPKSDRQVQFYEAPECENIKPTHSKEEALLYIKSNPGTTYQQLYDKFGDGSLNFKNELVASGEIKQEGDVLIC
jgi:hypothetical protein